MEIMKTFTSPLAKVCTSLSCVLLAGASTSLGADLALRKVPSATAQPDAVTIALVNYNTAGAQASAPKALYVSSGADIKAAGKIVDSQTSTNYAFSKSDAAPTAVIDLGTARALNRVSANFSAGKGTMSFYVMQTLPDTAVDAAPVDLPNTMKFSGDELSTMRPVAVVEDDGTRSDVAVDIPATTGRYVMVRWNPAVKQNAAFTLAEVAAFGGEDEQNAPAKKSARRHNDVSDSKTMVDAKDMGDAKDVPAEGPPEEAPPPGEGPPPGLPPPPPFTFIPQIVPTSP